MPELSTVQRRNHPLRSEITVEVPSLQDGLKPTQKVKGRGKQISIKTQSPQRAPFHVHTTPTKPGGVGDVCPVLETGTLILRQS